MKLVQILDEPVYGYWDGGKKQRFDWEITNVFEDDKGGFVRIGSWAANMWFCVALGKTEKLTLSYAKKHLKAITKIPSTFYYEQVYKYCLKLLFM